MAVELLLSPIRKDHSFKSPVQGRWQSAPDFLTKYASDIEIEGELSDRHAMQNVPSVFARPVYFYQALEDNRHPAHRLVRGQWRGLLAVFALQRWLGGAVNATEFSLPETLERARQASGRADLPLLTILESQLPKPTEEWQRWWLLRFHERLIGATSPWTIVYTPAEYRCPPVVPWQSKEGQLIDPLDYYDPKRKEQKRELSYLAAWVRLLLREEGNRWGVADRKALERPMTVVVRELQRWYQELKRYEKPDLQELELTDTTAPIREEPFDNLLIGLKLDQQAESDLLLETADGRRVLLLSRKGLGTGRRVYGAILADQLQLDRMPGPKGEPNWQAPNGQEIPFGYVFAEEAFLPAKLFELPLTKDAFSVGSDRLTVPLTPEFFRFFTLEQLLQQNLLADVSVTSTQVQVRLRLPLANDETFVVEKTYQKDRDVVVDQSGVASFGFWPDFYDPLWRSNLAFLGALAEASLVAAPLGAGGTVLRSCASNGTELPLRVWESAAPPLGFALWWRDPATGEEHPAGVLLRKKLTPPLPPREKAWTVAVDFGTSSTHLMVREEGNAEPRVLEFKPRTVLLTEAVGDLEFPVRTAFYPSRRPVEWPFPTLLYRNRGTLVEGRDAHASQRDLFSPDFTAGKELIDRIVDNLKWAGRSTSVETAPLLGYLRCLVRGAACEARAEGVNRLTFQWSFPLSLPAGSRHSMQEFWNAVSGDFSISKEMDVTEGGGTSESEALSWHLSRLDQRVMPIGAQSLSIAVDVGGGSSDIAFWSEKALLDQVSAKLAGNDILPPLHALPGLVAGLVEACAPMDSAALWQDLVRRKPATLLNILLSRPVDAQGNDLDVADPKTHPMPLWLAKQGKSGEPPWVIVRTMVYLFASGLAFYLGLHARKLLPTLEVKEITLAFGGRGSMLFTWLAQGAKLEEVLRAAFKAGLTLDEPGNARVEPRIYAPGTWFDPQSRPKHEVVRGLLAGTWEEREEARKKASSQRPTTTILGEVGWRTKAGESLGWDERVDARKLAELLPPPNHDSGLIADFLAQVVPQHLDELSLDTVGLKGLRLTPDRVQDALRASVTGGYEVLQPVFAVELKVLLELYRERAREVYGAG